MEQDRKALGLEGAWFDFHHCPQCGHNDIFLDIHPLEGETAQAFCIRKTELEAAARYAANGDASLVLVSGR